MYLLKKDRKLLILIDNTPNQPTKFTDVTLKISSNVAGDSNDENNFPHNLLLTNTQVSKLRRAFTNGSLANIKLIKTQMHKIGQSGGNLGRLSGLLLKSELSLIRNILKPLAETALMPLVLTAVVSATNAAIHKKIFESGNTTLIISNEEMNDVIKIIKSFQESGLLMPAHPLANAETQKYYQNEPKFNDVYSRNNLPKIKDGAYVINRDEFKSIGTQRIALYPNGNNIRTY